MQSHEIGLVVKCIALDPVISSSHDLPKEEPLILLRKAAKQRRVLGGHGGPPCTTFSRSRHRRLPGGGGPRPLRHRQNVWQPKAGLSAKEHLTALVGSLLALLVFGLLVSFAATGATVSLEHPADPGAEPYPSIFFSREFDCLRAFCRLLYGTLNQCMFGARTKAIFNRHNFASFLFQRCNHKFRYESVIGTDKQNPGKFATAALAR